MKIPAISPNRNPHAERLVKTIKHECLNRFSFFGERPLRYVPPRTSRSQWSEVTQ